MEDVPLMLTNHREAIEVPNHGKPHFCWVSFEGENESLNTLSNKNIPFQCRLARVSWSSMASSGSTMSGWCLQRQHFHAWQRLLQSFLGLIIPYRATDTTLDVASFPYGDEAHGLLCWCRSGNPLPCLSPCHEEWFLLCIIM